MQTVFTYGSRKSGITPKTILFGWSIADMGVMSYPFEAFARIGNPPFTEADIDAAGKAKDWDRLRAMIASLTEYRTKVGNEYHILVGRSSGSKADRRRAEGYNLPKLLAVLITRAQSILDGVVGVNPDGTPKVLPIPGSGAPGGNNASKDSGFSKLILPIGAGLAALFFLKGH